MKSKRQSRILEIVAHEDIETQEELLERLRQNGFKSTQATVSRDIRDLRLVKSQIGDGQYKYAISAEMAESAFSSRLRSIFRDSVISFEAAQNIVVLKTMPGLAPAACSALDALEHPDVAGTLAGDDTAFVAMRDNAAAAEFVLQIHNMLM